MATITALTDLGTVKARLGITTTNFDAQLQLIIDAVDIRIYAYCERNFTAQTYIQSDFGTNDDIVSLRNPPVNDLFYSAIGNTGAINITYVGASLANIEVNIDDYEQLFTIKFIEATAVTHTVVLTLLRDIDSVVAEINTFGNWTATAEQNTGGYPSFALLENFFPNIEQNNTTFLGAPTSGIGLRGISRVQGEYDAASVISPNTRHTVIYNGGYATIPDDLKEAATQICVNTFNLSQQDQNLQSEKIGNYAWTKATGDFISQVLPSWYSALTNYKNPALA